MTEELRDDFERRAGLHEEAREGATQIVRRDLRQRGRGARASEVLPEITIERATGRAERLRATVEGLFKAGDRVYGARMTASFGVASFPTHGATGDALLKAADVASYEAKRTGRNRVCIAVARDAPRAA